MDFDDVLQHLISFDHSICANESNVSEYSVKQSKLAKLPPFGSAETLSQSGNWTFPQTMWHLQTIPRPNDLTRLHTDLYKEHYEFKERHTVLIHIYV